jgi:hypothetical protein
MMGGSSLSLLDVGQGFALFFFFFFKCRKLNWALALEALRLRICFKSYSDYSVGLANWTFFIHNQQNNIILVTPPDLNE